MEMMEITYRLELLNEYGSAVYIQTGIVPESGNWIFSIETIKREIAPQTVDRVVIKWGEEANHVTS